MRRTVFVVATLGWAACATVPQPPPVLAAPGKRVALAGTWGLPYTPTRATVSGSEIPSTVIEHHYGRYEPGRASLLFDPRFSFAHRISDRLHWGGHLGWATAGLELRSLPRGDLVDIPVVVTLGAQLNVGPASFLGPSDGAIWDARAELSAQPRLLGCQLLLGAGLSAGRQRYDLYIPDGPLGGSPEWVASYLVAVRAEGRLEGVIGISFSVGPHRIAIAAQPYRVVANGAVSTAYCGSCLKDLHVDALDASWGVAFTLTGLVSVR